VVVEHIAAEQSELTPVLVNNTVSNFEDVVLELTFPLEFTGLRYFALDGTDHQSHSEQGRSIRPLNQLVQRNPHDRHLSKVVDRANVA